MAVSVNKVILIGNLGKDPELRSFDNGGSVVNFPIATTESYRNRETGERVELPTDWHNIAIRKAGLVKVADTYLKKGDRVYIEGKLRYRTYEKDGQTRYITEIVADELSMLSGRSDAAQVSQGGGQEARTNPVQTDATPSADDLPF
jgi:single-strand DNA-binding protein